MNDLALDHQHRRLDTRQASLEVFHIHRDLIDQLTINLEHVLPQCPGVNWPSFAEEAAQLYTSRLGNQALMRASDNSELRSAPFTEKKIYAESPYVLTSQIAQLATWTPAAVEERQRKLAELALRAWPLL